MLLLETLKIRNVYALSVINLVIFTFHHISGPFQAKPPDEDDAEVPRYADKSSLALLLLLPFKHAGTSATALNQTPRARQE